MSGRNTCPARNCACSRVRAIWCSWRKQKRFRRSPISCRDLPAPREVCSKRTGAVAQGTAVSQVERPGWCFQSESAADIDKKFSLLKDVRAVECAGAVNKDQPLEIHIRVVQNIEKREPPDSMIECGVHERKARPHGRAAEVSRIRDRAMPSQVHVGRRGWTQAHDEVFIH